MRLRQIVQTASLLFALAPAWAGAQLQPSRLTGQLVSGNGSPVVGAEVTVAGSLLLSPSDSSGRFVLDAIPAGQVRVQARALGFSPLDTVLTLQPGEAHSVTFRMTRNVQQLAPVITEAVLAYGKPLRYQHTGRFDDFYERRAKRPGTFLTREDIENSGRSTVMELMSSVAGVRVSYRYGRESVRIARCVGSSIYGGQRPDSTEKADSRIRWLAVYIDGQRMSSDPMDLLGELKTDEIETMEFFRGPSQVPMEAVGDACAALFITTRFTTGSVLTNK